MADLTFAALKTKLPEGSITASAGDLLISVQSVMGEASVGLNDQKIGEFFSKILEAASKAQNDWNAINNPKFRSYNSPSTSAPYLDPETGNYVSSFTYTLVVNIPLNRDNVDAVETSSGIF